MKITDICRYPVRSLTAETLSKIELKLSHAILNDRRFGLLLNSTPLTGATADWMPRCKFLCLMHNEHLAALTARFDDTTYILTIFRGGKQISRGKLTDNTGRTSIEAFFAAYIEEESKGWPRIVEGAGDHVLSDHKPPVLSIPQLGICQRPGARSTGRYQSDAVPLEALFARVTPFSKGAYDGLDQLFSY